jgi:hypothetical protein
MVPAVGGAIVFFCSPGSGVHPELGKATNLSVCKMPRLIH